MRLFFFIAFASLAFLVHLTISVELSNDDLTHLLDLLDNENEEIIQENDKTRIEDDFSRFADLLGDFDDLTTTNTPIFSTTNQMPQTTQAPPTTTQAPVSEAPGPMLIAMERREDLPPSGIRLSESELISQLSQFNSLLNSLTNNNPELNRTNDKSSNIPNSQPLAVLESLFGPLPTPLTTQATITTPTTTLTTTQSTTSAPPLKESDLLLKLLTQSLSQSQPLAPPTAIQATTPTLSPTKTQLDSLKALLTQIAHPQSTQLTSLDPLANFHTNNNELTPSSSNQLTSLLSLLGTLGSLTSLTQPVPQQNNNNFLANLLNPPQNNIFGQPNLFSQPVVTSASTIQNIGTGLTSIFSTMANALGSGNKPAVRGKGVDTRLGLGYRLGDAADAQLVFDIGPQLFTQPIKNEIRNTVNRRKETNFAHKVGQPLNQNYYQTPKIVKQKTLEQHLAELHSAEQKNAKTLKTLQQKSQNDLLLKQQIEKMKQRDLIFKQQLRQMHKSNQNIAQLDPQQVNQILRNKNLNKRDYDTFFARNRQFYSSGA